MIQKTITRRILPMLPRFLLFAAINSTSLPAKAVDNGVTLSAPQISTNHNYRFSFQGTAHQIYPIAVSTDLVHWSSLTNQPGAAGLNSVQDDHASDFQQRFYHIGVHPTPITNMVWIPPGVFTMGSPDSEPFRSVNEGPQTVVTLTQGFWMGKFEVAQQEYETLMQSGPVGYFRGDPNLPVDFMSWSAGTNYCQHLSDSETAAGHLPPGWIYRLPTEAEWEYACRAGKTTPFSVGSGTSLSSLQATFDGGYPYGDAPAGPFRNRTTVVGSFAPNAWGLYDMHGNVWEWCQDVYAPYPGGSVTDPKGPATGPSRVARGGDFNATGLACRSSRRDVRGPTYSNFGYGFRVVLARNP